MLPQTASLTDHLKHGNRIFQGILEMGRFLQSFFHYTETKEHQVQGARAQSNKDSFYRSLLFVRDNNEVRCPRKTSLHRTCNGVLARNEIFNVLYHFCYKFYNSYQRMLATCTT